jgi:hypothetical protein
VNHPERSIADDRVDEADNSTDRCLEGDDDERWQRDLAWAREALAPFRDIPLTPEQERGLVLWETRYRVIAGKPLVARTQDP